MDTFMMWRYRAAEAFVASSAFLREETVEVSGAKVACYVVSVTPEPKGSAYIWWIDKASGRIVREDHDGTSAVFTTISLNETLPDELFKFDPPPGATKMQ
jgi:outer membrane lipoprotein-sorting protein